ncbi:hypothetical protein BDZ45DRAFT_144454 [Acephala macrosclerotiorum]|nr:hypothetical protein BDZ45DRAFT_144454 [Acephala macrosclerotiorum]
MDPLSVPSTALRSQKGKTVARNDAKWDSLKDEIKRMYMVENATLAQTMLLVHQLYGFQASERKWKSKLKEWGFDKNLTMAEMKIAVAKAEKRYTEDGKDTVFFHRGDFIPPAKVQNWKRRIMMTASSPLNPNAKTPVTIAYFTPVSCVTPISPVRELIEAHQVSHGLPVAPVRELIEIDESSALGSTQLEIDHISNEYRPVQAALLDENTFLSQYFRGRASFTSPSSFLRCFMISRVTSSAISRESWAPFCLSPGIHPANVEAGFQYCCLRVERHGMIFRFRPKFISGMFASNNLDEYMMELYEILLDSFQFAQFSSGLGPFEDRGPVALTDQLGQALVKNHDLPNAVVLATILDRALKAGTQVDELPFQDYVLDRWHQDQASYEASMPFSAGVQLCGDGSDGALSNLANTTRKLLLNYYQQEPGSGSFQNDILDTAQQAARSGEFERAHHISSVLLTLTPTFLAHVMDPLSLAEMHLAISKCYEGRLSGNGCGACISLSARHNYPSSCWPCTSAMQECIRQIEHMRTDQAFIFPLEVQSAYVSARTQLLLELDPLSGSLDRLSLPKESSK